MAEPIETVTVTVVIEDDPVDAELTRRALQSSRSDNQVITLDDGATAIERLLNDDSPLEPDLILLDLKLPGLSGLEVLQHLRAHPGTRTVPIVMLSSSDLTRDINEAYARGANSFVTKPQELLGYRTALATLANYWLKVNMRPARRPARA